MKRVKLILKSSKWAKKISHGGFGIVYKVEEIETKNIYAAKIISYDDDENMLNNLIDREVSMMINVQHPTIIKFIGYSTVDFNDDVSLVIFMELAPNGSLSEVIKSIIRSNGPKYYNNTTRQIILIGVARGMKYLHDRSIIHRDLKPGNILLNSNFQPLLTDFGMAKYFEVGHSHSQSQFGGTKPYQAPEILKGEKYDGKVDVYAFGILMFEVLTDSFAYPEFYNGKLTDFSFQCKVINDDYRPVFPFPVNEKLQELAKECWSENPNDRPSFGEIFEKLCNEEYFLEDVDADEISFYVDDITEITDSTEKLLNKIKVLRKQNSILKNENDKNIAKIVKIEKENLNLKEEMNHLKKANEAVEHEKQDLNKIVIELKEENVKNRKKIDACIKDIQQYQDANLKLKKENNQMVSKIVSSENDKKKLQMEIDKLKIINKKYLDEIAQLNENKSKANNNIQTAKNDQDEINAGKILGKQQNKPYKEEPTIRLTPEIRHILMLMDNQVTPKTADQVILNVPWYRLEKLNKLLNIENIQPGILMNAPYLLVEFLIESFAIDQPEQFHHIEHKNFESRQTMYLKMPFLMPLSFMTINEKIQIEFFNLPDFSSDEMNDICSIVLTTISQREMLVISFNDVDKNFPFSDLEKLSKELDFIYLYSKPIENEEMYTISFTIKIMQYNWSIEKQLAIKGEISHMFNRSSIFECSKCGCLFSPIDGSKCFLTRHKGRQIPFPDSGEMEKKFKDIAGHSIVYVFYECCGEVEQNEPGCRATTIENGSHVPFGATASKMSVETLPMYSKKS